MANLKEYLKDMKDKDKTSLVAPTASHISSVISKELSGSGGFVISNSNAKPSEFSDKLAELATSDQVMGELSDTIGTPRSHETEDAFVERAKSALSTILKRKLSEKI